jgi:hypothetical protein
MRLIFLTALLPGAATASAQQCNCEAEFKWVKSFMEKNHPGSQEAFLINLLTIMRIEVKENYLYNKI